MKSSRRCLSIASALVTSWLLCALPLTGCVGRAPEPAPAAVEPLPLSLPDATRPEISAADLEAHVAALTDRRTEGRRAGSPGEQLAADYLAAMFRSLGLEPAAEDERLQQTFVFTAGIDLGPDNALRISPAGAAGAAPVVGEDWRPLAFSRSGSVPASPLVFAGYGLLVPADQGRAAIDEYAGIDVRDRWVMVFRDLPGSFEGETRQALQQYASLRYKAMVARDHGARGILFVSGPKSGFRESLVPLRFDASLAGTRIAVVSIADGLAERLLAGTGSSLEQIQSAVDRELAGDAPAGFDRPGRIEDVEIAARIDLETRKRRGTNVVARLQVGATASEQTIVLGAHFDHLGRGEGSSSLASGDEVGQIHPGADDNASGTALLLEIAQALAARQRAGEILGQRDFLFAAWSGEELGLLGSNAWVEANVDPHSDATGPIAYLNFDMVGRLEDALVVQGLGSSDDWAALLERVSRASALEISLQQDSYVPSDSTSFYTQGVPVLNAFTGVHSEYHSPRDTPDLLDFESMAAIGELFATIAVELSRAEAPPAYRAQQAPTAGQGRSGFRVFLGTVPDYAQTDIVGVRLSGVAPGGPAETAGIEGGDVIVELDGRPIENLYDYTYALDALRVGMPARMVVLRDDERIELEVVPASRD